MDRTTVFTKTAKGLMEATGKTSALSRDLRALLKEIDGKATLAEVQARFGKLPEAKLQEALTTLAKGDFVREFTQSGRTPAPPPKTAAPSHKASAAGGDMDLDFTAAIPTISTIAKQAEEAARQKAQATAAAEVAARAKAEAEARTRAAAAEAAARARAEAEAKAKAEALEKAKAAAAAARAKAEAEARAKAAAEAAARAKAEAEAKARAEAEARAKAEAEARAKREAEERARQEAEARAKAEQQARIEAEARARKEAEERALVEAELKARLEEERKAKEEAERERKAAEEKARREADELRAKLEQERKAREEAERKANKEAERRSREDAERKAKEEAERARKEAEEKARREAEEQTRREAEERARTEQVRVETEARTRKEAEEAGHRAREEAERKAKEESERSASEEAERKAREEAERKRKEAEEQARREAEGQARREAEERAGAQEQARVEAEQPPAPVESGSSLDDLVKIETDFDAVLREGGGAAQDAAKRSAGAEDALQKGAEEIARRQEEEQARMAAEAKAREEAEAAARRAEETRRRKDEGERAPERTADASAYEREHAEAQTLLDAQDAETERHFAEMEKELDAEQAGAPGIEKPAVVLEHAREREQEATKERFRAAAAVHPIKAEIEPEQAPPVYRTPVNWGKPVALGLFLLLVLGLVSVNFVSFDGYIPQFEKLVGAHLQQPVKIKLLHLALVPQPHWRLDGVSVGNEGQLEVARVNAVAELGSMFSDKKAFTSIELESPVLSEEGLHGLLFGKPAGQDFKVANVIVKNGKLNSKTIVLPALDAKIAVGEDGVWRQIALETPDHKTSLLLKPDGEGAQIEVETNAFSLPFDPSFILENFNAKGVIRRGELRLSELKGAIYGGYLSGNASLKWGADWNLGGEISVRAMDPARFAPGLFEEGKLEGKAAYTMRAKSYDELFAAPRLEGSFAIEKGTLLGVDLGRLLQGGGVGGKTAFTELTGNFVREAGRTQLRQIHLGAGPVSAGGNADADAGKRISGRFPVEIKSPVAQARANLALSGTLKEPHFSR